MALKSSKEISIGARAEGGSSQNFSTGGWRAMRPERDSKKCINCMMCFLYCPDNAITIIKEGKNKKPEITGIDLEHCKGCGVCASVCPVKCITMVEEK
jgi:pyruvate ferredoxin oxidoreductase delta subunit